MLPSIFILERCKFVTEIYLRAINCISQEYKIHVSNSLTDANNKLLTRKLLGLNLIIVDYRIKDEELNSFISTENFILSLRMVYSNVKIIYLTDFINGNELLNFSKLIQPEALVDKNEVDFDELCSIFKIVMDGGNFYAKTINIGMKHNKSFVNYLGPLNLKIILLLSQGIATKNLPKYLPLSLSGIHKRKAKIKSLLNIDDGTDEMIIRQAKIQGII